MKYNTIIALLGATIGAIAYPLNVESQNHSVALSSSLKNESSICYQYNRTLSDQVSEEIDSSLSECANISISQENFSAKSDGGSSFEIDPVSDIDAGSQFIEESEVEVSSSGSKPSSPIDRFWKSVEKYTSKESLYQMIAKDTDMPPFQVMKKVNKAVNSIWKKEDTIKCKDTKKGFKGLCVASNHRIIYKNENRASRHLFRSIFMPVHGYLTMKTTHLVQYLICNNEIYDPIRDYINCNIMQYYYQLTEVIFGGLMVLGYQELTGKPFHTMAVKLANAYAAVGYKFAGYNAVSHDGQVVPLNGMPKGFDLSYVFSNYGDPDGRNASLAIFPGNKNSEVGFSFISKPWDPAPVAPSIPGSYMNIEQYHWKYVMKIDLDEINYQLDQMSPEELFHNVATNIANIKDYLYFGGGLFTDKHDLFLKVDEIKDDQEDDVDNDIVLSDDDDEVFKVNFHGIKIRISLEQNSTHTVHWNEH